MACQFGDFQWIKITPEDLNAVFRPLELENFLSRQQSRQRTRLLLLSVLPSVFTSIRDILYQTSDFEFIMELGTTLFDTFSSRFLQESEV